MGNCVNKNCQLTLLKTNSHLKNIFVVVLLKLHKPIGIGRNRGQGNGRYCVKFEVSTPVKCMYLFSRLFKDALSVTQDCIVSNGRVDK
jgi:hypothetical protein